MKRARVGVVLAAAVLLAAEAAAGPINITAIRGVMIGAGSATSIGSNSPSSALGAFNDAIQALYGSPSPEEVSAEQGTDINAGAGRFSGTGSTGVGFSVLQSDEVFASSYLDVFFDLLTDHSYALEGSLSANMDGGYGEALFNLIGPTGLSFSSSDTSDFLSSGTLTAGSYHLLVSSAINNGGYYSEVSYMGGSSAFDFDLVLTPTDTVIPEPGTLALLGAGLAAAAARRRWSKRS